MSAVLDRPEAPVGARLSGIFRRYTGRILGVYGLFNAENLLRLAQPIALGWAIDGLLRGEWLGVMVLALQHVATMVLTSSRQAIDTRVFAGIYADMVSDVVIEQRSREVPAGIVAARSTMSREFVDFFEMHLPAIFQAAWSLVGAVVMLWFFDWALVVCCVALLIPAGILNHWYGKHTLFLSAMLHGEQEREVGVIDRSDSAEVRDHYGKVRSWWVRLSDAEAINTGIMEMFVLALIVGSLVRYCGTPGVTTGDIFAAFRYVLMFVMALDGLPNLVKHVSRLRDVGRRIANEQEGDENPS